MTAFLQETWFILIALIFLAFMLLDGFDLGLGMAFPFAFREERDRKAVLDLVWPFWDGNELWAVIGGASLLAVFPAVFAGLLGGLAPWVAAGLCFLMLRTVAFEAWYHDPKRRRLWELILAAGSFVLAFGFGLLAGNLFAGLPIDGAGTWSGSLLTPLRPAPLALGALSATASLLHGACYLRRKSRPGSSLRAAADGLALRALPVAALLAAGLLAAAALLLPGVAAKPLFWAGAAGLAAAGLGILRSLKGSSGSAPFSWSVAALAAAWLAGGAALHPWLLRPFGALPGLDIHRNASPDSSLALLTPVAIAMLALVAGYTVFVYRVFKGKPEPSGASSQNKESSMKTEAGAAAPGALPLYVRCKACGYIMEADKVGESCPACGVPAKQFEPYDDRVSPRRRRIIELHLHPVIVHAPQAIAALLLLFGLCLFLPLGSLREPLATTARVLAVLLPFTVVAAFLSGLFDGKLRFRRVTTPLLRRKMLFGALFFLGSLAAGGLALLGGLAGLGLVGFVLASALSLGAGAYLGIMGAGLMVAKFPG